MTNRGGGLQGYGIYTPGGTFAPPLAEELVNSLPKDYAKTVVYPVFRDVLTKASENKGWTWCEICPDAIVRAIFWFAVFGCGVLSYSLRELTSEEIRSGLRRTVLSFHLPFTGLNIFHCMQITTARGPRSLSQVSKRHTKPRCRLCRRAHWQGSPFTHPLTLRHVVEELCSM